MRQQLPAVIALALAWLNATAAGPLDGLTPAIETARVQWRAPGLAAAIVKDGRIVYARGFGDRHLATASPVDERTLFTLASTTKAFTALAVGMLVDDGSLQWDDAVIEHLPEFRVKDAYVTRELTIRDLLAHRSGVEPTDILWLRGFDTPTAIEHLAHANRSTSLRSQWGYDNTMYVVAAEVVARVSGLSFEAFVTRRIFAPLGMTDSRFTGPALNELDNVAGAHLVTADDVREIDRYVSPTPLGAAGIQASVTDMTKWIRLLLDEGEYEGRRIVGSDVVAETLTPQMLLAEPAYPAAAHANPQFYAYGLGWFLQDYRGLKVAMHTGSLFGANALVALVPELRMGLVILIDAGPVEYRHAFLYDVIDRYVGGGQRDWSAELHALYAGLAEEKAARRDAVLAARPRHTQPSRSLPAYAGAWSNPLAGRVRIWAPAGGSLVLEMPPSGFYDLEHWSYDTFEAADRRAPETERFRIRFELAADGNVAGFETASGRVFRRVSESAEDDG